MSQCMFHGVFGNKVFPFPHWGTVLIEIFSWFICTREIKHIALIDELRHSALLNSIGPFIFDLEEQPSLGGSSREIYSSFITFEKLRGKTEWDCVYKECGKLSDFCSVCSLAAGTTWSDGSSRESCWLVLSNLTPQVNTDTIYKNNYWTHCGAQVEMLFLMFL